MSIYLLPLIGTGTKEDPRRPAYIQADAPGVEYSLMDYGTEPVCLMHANPSLAQHLLLIAHADVVALPANLDQQIGAQQAVVQNALQTLNIPENWVQSSFTYRQVLRVVALIFQFMQRLNFVTVDRLFGSGITLSTRFNQLPQAMRQQLIAAANSLGYDTSSLSGTNTLRSILKTLADQSNLLEVFLGEEVL